MDAADMGEEFSRLLASMRGDWRNLKIAGIDFETTGLNAKDEGITEIGIVLFERGEVLKPYCRLVNPGRKIKKRAAEASGINDEDVKDQKPFSERVKSVKKLLGIADIWVAFNDQFDRSFLYAECERCGVHIDERPTIDPLIWANWLWPGERNNLDAVAQRLRVTLSSDDKSYLKTGSKRHRADYDAMLVVRCLYEMASYMPRTLRQTLWVQDYLYWFWLQRHKHGDTKYARYLTPTLPPEALGDE